MENYEERYYRLRREMREAEMNGEWSVYEQIRRIYAEFCMTILENLMEENSEALKRLKRG